MSKARLIMVACMAVMAISAVAASSASAGWMVGGTTLSGSEKLTSKAPKVTNASLESATLHIVCEGEFLEEGRVLKLKGPPIYVYHEIVHNKHVVESLKAKGIHIGIVNVAAAVAVESPTSVNIADEFWKLYESPKDRWVAEVTYSE